MENKLRSKRAEGIRKPMSPNLADRRTVSYRKYGRAAAEAAVWKTAPEKRRLEIALAFP